MSEEMAQSETELAAAIAENPDAVADLVRRLDAVNELLDVLALGESALTDEMVTSLAGTGASLGEIAESTGDGETRDGIETLLSGLSEAESEEATPVGPIGLLKATRDPDVQHGLGYLLAIAQAIGRARSVDDTR